MSKLIISFRAKPNIKDLIMREAEKTGISLSEWIELKMTRLLSDKTYSGFNLESEEKILIKTIDSILHDLKENLEMRGAKIEDTYLENAMEYIMEQIFIYYETKKKA